MRYPYITNTFDLWSVGQEINEKLKPDCQLRLWSPGACYPCFKVCKGQAARSEIVSGKYQTYYDRVSIKL